MSSAGTPPGSSSSPSVLERLRLMLSPRHRSIMRLCLWGGIILGLAFVVSLLWGNRAAKRNAASSVRKFDPPTRVTSPGSHIDPKDVWMTQSAQQIKQLQDQIAALNATLEAERKKRAEDEEKARSLLPPLPPAPKRDTTTHSSTIPKTPAKPSSDKPSDDGGGKKGGAGERQGPDSGPPPSKPEPRKPAAAVFDVSKLSDTQQNAESRKSYVPAGSFAKAVMLAGLDAPTGGQAQDNPHPVLIRIHREAILPNKYWFDVRECFVIGEGYGDISSERAFIRLDNLSCIRNDGTAIDTPIKGYAVGEDGKAGIRGRLVTKQGQILANALLAGIGSGLGRSLEQSAMRYQSTIYGEQGYIDPDKTLQAGLGYGVGKALDRLAQYYISLAEKLFPVIEVDAGRTIEIVLTKGLSLDDDVYLPSEGKYSEIWKLGRRGKPLNPYQSW